MKRNPPGFWIGLAACLLGLGLLPLTTTELSGSSQDHLQVPAEQGLAKCCLTPNAGSLDCDGGPGQCAI